MPTTDDLGTLILTHDKILEREVLARPRVPKQSDSDHQCYEKAKARGDLTFTVVGQDRSSPRAICFWIMENIETAPLGKLEEALHKAVRMRDLAGRKAAD